MSQKKQKISKEEKALAKRKKDNKRFFIILGVAIFVIAAAVIVTAVILPKMKAPRVIDDPDFKSEFEYVTYGNGILPREFAEIIGQAELDEAEACKQTGVAFTCGKREISRDSMVMYYIDAYTRHVMKASTDISIYGHYTEKMSFEMYPEFNKYTDDVTYGQQMLMEAEQNLAQNYYLFDKAIDDGFAISDLEIHTIKDDYESIVKYASTNNTDIKAMIKKNYNTDYVTMEMYSAMRIIETYANAYEKKMKAEETEKVSNSEVNKRLKGNERDYQVFKGRIFPFDEEIPDYSSVKDNDSFIAYLKGIYGDYDELDIKSDASYVTYAKLKELYGEKVADFVFSPERKAGEVADIDNGAKKFLIYIEKPAYFETGVQCVLVYNLYQTEAGEERENEMKMFQEEYNNWVSNGAKKSDLLKIDLASFATTTDAIPTGYISQRVNSLNTYVDQWLRDPVRKEGDHAIFFLNSSVVYLYFEKVNKDDYDYIATIKEEIAKENFDLHYSYKLDKKYPVKYVELFPPLDTEVYEGTLEKEIFDTAHDPVNALNEKYIYSRVK